MIRNLRIVPRKQYVYDLSNGYFATFEYQGRTKKLNIQDVYKYWEYATEEDLEGISAVIDNDLIIAFFRVATGQGGVVTVWNSDGQLIHISQGSFVIASAIYDGFVYTLRAVIYWGHKLSFHMQRIPLGTMDIAETPDESSGFVFNEKEAYGSYISGYDVFLHITEKEYIISYEENKKINTFIVSRDNDFK